MADLDSVPKLVRDAQLPAEFLDNRVIVHRGYQGNQSQEERWLRDTEELGEGTYGAVWREQEIDHNNLPKQGRVRAVKVIKLLVYHKLSTDHIRELEAMLNLSRGKAADRFVRITGWFISQHELSIAMEFCTYGSMQVYINKNRLREDEAKIVTQQLLQGLACMHEVRLAHRDLKPDVSTTSTLHLARSKRRATIHLL